MRLRSALLLLLTLLPAPLLAATLGDARVGFAADRTLVIDGRSYAGKIWAMPGRERHEQVIQGFRPVFLLRADSPLGEIVLAQLKTIVEFALPAPLRLLAGPAKKRHPLGPDTVNGVATTKYAIAEAMPEGRAAGTLWLSREGIPMRIAGDFTATGGKVSTIRWELSHVRVGSQPAALFEVPQGFSRLPAEAVAPLLGLHLKGGGALNGR
jgi:hypothetical protein